jgi:hypothetical protein
MTHLRVAIGTVLLALGLVAVAPADLAASHLGKGIPDETTVSVSFVASAHKQIPDRLAALLVAYDGKPIGKAEIEFRQEIEFLGPRLALLGRGVTDATGVAQVPIKATDSPLRIEVRFGGNERYAASSTTVDVALPPGSAQVRGDATFEPSRPGVGLGQLASVMPPLIAGAALGVWVVLVALTLMTIRGIKRSQRVGIPERGGNRIGPR